jgi:hypothetical protein
VDEELWRSGVWARSALWDLDQGDLKRVVKWLRWIDGASRATPLTPHYSKRTSRRLGRLAAKVGRVDIGTAKNVDTKQVALSEVTR